MNAVATGLQAALLLARGRPEGAGMLGAPPGEDMRIAARSFWAMAVTFPAFLCLHLIDWLAAPPASSPGHDLALDVFGYVIGWIGFALLSRPLATAFGRGAAWPRFLAVWNWCNCLQYLMLLVASLPGAIGMPDWFAQAAWLVAVGWALWLEWYATRLTLTVTGPIAAAVVALDAAVGLLLLAFTEMFR